MRTTSLENIEMDPTIWRAVVPESFDNDMYYASHIKKLNGLVNREDFTLFPERKAQGCLIYKSRFIDEIKHDGTTDAFCQVDTCDNGV